MDVELPDDFQEWYPGDIVLCMNILLYHTKQTVYRFFKTFAKHAKDMTCKQSKADLCLYFAQIDDTIVMLVMWVGDVILLEPPLLGKMAQPDLKKAFMCKYKGEFTKYMGSKIAITITHNNTGLGTVKFTQPVLVCKLLEEYKPSGGPASKTPAITVQKLIKRDGIGL